MADGSTKPIEDVEIGDWVWAHDPETGETGPRRVVDTIVGDGVKALVEIRVGGAVVTATAQHPFWVDGDGAWVDAEDLEAGDVLLAADRSTARVQGVEQNIEVRTVHNLTVDGIHTYFVTVGDNEILVHNCARSAAPSAFTRTEALSGRASARTVSELAESMRGSGWQGAPINVVEHNGQLLIVDGHHRVAAARLAGIDVPYQIVEPSSVISLGQWSSLDDILRDSYGVGPDRIRPR